MTSYKSALVFALVVPLALPLAASAQAPGGPDGVDIKIRAKNRSITDTPFCGSGGGMVGDRLTVNAYMDSDGVVTGKATFKDANGAVTKIKIDRLFPYFGGVLVQNDDSQDTVAIWMWDQIASGGQTTSLVNVELPRGCANTVSTFTPGIDKVLMQVKFK